MDFAAVVVCTNVANEVDEEGAEEEGIEPVGEDVLASWVELESINEFTEDVEEDLDM